MTQKPFNTGLNSDGCRGASTDDSRGACGDGIGDGSSGIFLYKMSKLSTIFKNVWKVWITLVFAVLRKVTEIVTTVNAPSRQALGYGYGDASRDGIGDDSPDPGAVTGAVTVTVLKTPRFFRRENFSFKTDTKCF